MRKSKPGMVTNEKVHGMSRRIVLRLALKGVAIGVLSAMLPGQMNKLGIPSARFAWAAPSPIQLSPQIPDGTSPSYPHTFYRSQPQTVTINSGDTVKLCSDPNGQQQLYTDDRLRLTVTSSAGTQSFEIDFSRGNQGFISPEPPRDITSFFRPGGNTVTLELINQYPPIYNSSPYYLLFAPGSSSPPGSGSDPLPYKVHVEPPALVEVKFYVGVLKATIEWKYTLDGGSSSPVTISNSDGGRSITVSSDQGSLTTDRYGDVTSSSLQPSKLGPEYGFDIDVTPPRFYLSASFKTTVQSGGFAVTSAHGPKTAYEFRVPPIKVIPNISNAMTPAVVIAVGVGFIIAAGIAILSAGAMPAFLLKVRQFEDAAKQQVQAFAPSSPEPQVQASILSSSEIYQKIFETISRSR